MGARNERRREHDCRSVHSAGGTAGVSAVVRESAAALLRDLSRNADALGRASVADARAIRRALLDAEYLSRHVRLTLERG